jgi:hypothetical protein
MRPGYGKYELLSEDQDTSRSEREANLMLMMAAPDLLDALFWALSQIEDDLDPDHQKAHAAAWAAVAKATGEQA